MGRIKLSLRKKKIDKHAEVYSIDRLSRFKSTAEGQDDTQPNTTDRFAVNNGKPIEQTKKNVKVSKSSRAKRLSKTKAYQTVKRAKDKTKDKVTSTKTYRQAKKQTKEVHNRFIILPHLNLMDRSRVYAWWHSWNIKKINHNHVHGILAGVWTFAMITAVMLQTIPTQALSTWTQSDWSGGVGSNTSNQYLLADNIETSVNGQLSLSKTSNSFTNPNFNSNTNSWNGLGVSQNNSYGHDGTGTAQITAGGVTSNKFNSTTTYPATHMNMRIAGGDLNGNGRKDVAIATAGGIAIYFSNADGTVGPANLQAGITDLNYYDVKIVDIDNDGDNDMVATPNATQQKYSVYYNNGSGIFTRTDFDYSSQTRYCSVTVIDIDNNGWKDVVFACYLQPNLFYAFNNSAGGFTATNVLAGMSSNLGSNPVILSGDINGDGKMDVVLAANHQYTCQFFYSLGTGGGLSAVTKYTLSNCGDTVATQSNSITIGDFDEDGCDDVAVPRRKGTGGDSSGDGYSVSVLFGTTEGSFAKQLDLTAATGAGVSQSGMRSVDVDNDGNLDIVTVTYGYQSISVFPGNGDGTFGNREDYMSGQTLVSDIELTDLKGDGKMDLLVSHFNNPSAGSLIIMSNRTVGNTLTQSLNLNNNDVYQLEAYARNVSGSAINNADVQIIQNGSLVNTTFTNVGGGWYRLNGKVTASTSHVGYGVIAKQGKTILVDDMMLYKYASNGILTSSTLDLTYGGDWDKLNYSSAGNGTVAVKVRTSQDPDMNGASDFSGCSAISNGTDMTGQSCINNNDRYVQYQIILTASDGDSPSFQGIDINYAPYDNDIPENNASNISMKREAGGSSINSNGWTNGSTPYFEWDSGADSGSGIKGYCLYLGQSATDNPITSKGLLGASPVDTNGACQFIVENTFIDLSGSSLLGTQLTTSDSPYYLNIRAIDAAGNVFGSSEQFQFRFDNTPPTNPAYINSPSQFVSNKAVTMTWPTSGGDAAADSNSGLAGLQYMIGNTTWYGENHNGNQDASDLLTPSLNNGTYTTINNPDFNNINQGNNVVYFRSWDIAGNVSSTYVTTVIKYNDNAPSGPLNLQATPATNTANNFAFSWSAPSSYTGSANDLTYCYTVNTLPTENTCNWTMAGSTSLPSGAYATQPGDNTFYVVAKDNTVNYATASSVTFTANTSAPGMPLETDIADVSIKATSSWRLAITWEKPTNTGAGVASYKIFRSTDNNNFNQIATSSGTSYVDSGLSQTKYYYKIRACDSANNCGAFGATAQATPTGKFTTPASITAQPSISGVSTKKATVKWSTDRVSDSKISLGTISGAYEPFQVASLDQVTDHKVELANLTPGTTYFAKATWTDEDGNTGYSSEFSFRTAPAPSTQEVTATRVSLNSAQISFTSVSAARVVVQFGKSDSFGGIREMSTSLSKSSYVTELTGLDDGNKYFYRLNTFDTEGNEYVGSTVFSFTTPPRPRVNNLQFQPVEGEPTSTQKVSWSTNVPATSLVRLTSSAIPAKEYTDPGMKTEHEVIIRDLIDDTEYSLTAESRDSDGNLALSDIQSLKTALDTRPPKIFDISIETTIKGTGTESRGQVIVSWKTDEPATSQVAYGEGSQTTVFNNKTSRDDSLSTEHIVIVSDLPTSRVYSVQPLSEDKGRNMSEGKISSAIIGRASDSVLTVVLNSMKRIFGF